MEKIVRNDGSVIKVETTSNDSNRLCLVFSGYNYNYRNPYLHYTKKMLLDEGFSSIAYDYEYYCNDFFENASDEEQEKYFDEDTARIIEHIKSVLSIKKYEEVILIGKSLGVAVLYACIDKIDFQSNIKLILITPGTRWNEILPKLQHLNNEIFLVASKKDNKYSVENLDYLKSVKRLVKLELNDGNHSLETNSIEGDLVVLEEVLSNIKRFVKNGDI